MKGLGLHLGFIIIGITGCSTAKHGQNATNLTEQDRMPSSMKWEEVPKEAMPETEVNWYQKEVTNLRKKMSDTQVALANRIAQAKLRGGTCSGDFYYSDVMNAYLSAVEGNPKAKFDHTVVKILEQSLTYRVVEKMRANSQYPRLYLGNLEWALTQHKFEQSDFDGVYFEAMATGAYGSRRNIVLNKDGTFAWNELKYDENRSPDFYWTSGKGVWSIKHYENAVRGRGKSLNNPDALKEYERRGTVVFLDFDGNGKFPKAYRVRYRDGDFTLETRKEDFSTDDYHRGSYYSSVTGECDA